MKGLFLILTAFFVFGINAETVTKNSDPFAFPFPTRTIGQFSVQSKDIEFSYNLHSLNQSIVTLSWALPVKADRGSISIFTLSGIKIKTIAIAEPQGSINMGPSNGGKLPNGVYIASLSYGMCKKNIQMLISK
jgi:hypothetical protein